MYYQFEIIIHSKVQQLRDDKKCVPETSQI